MENEAYELKKTSHPADAPVHVDAMICTSDGNEIGRVSEVTDTHFKVAKSMARDFWLSRSAVSSGDGTRVNLTFDSNDLDNYRMEGPGAQADSPIADAQVNAFESAEEEAARRERMISGKGQMPGDR